MTEIIIDFIKNNLIEFIESNFMEMLVAIFGVIGTYIGNRIKDKYNEKVNNETKRKVVESVVNAVEQLYQDLSGEEKLEKAKISAIEILNEKGINITDLELSVLIEAVVNGFNQGFRGE